LKRGKLIAYFFLIFIPTAFILFLLAMVNILLMFVGVIVILGGLLVLKRKKPEIFAFGKSEAREYVSTVRPEPRPAKPQVYMVLSDQKLFDEQRIMVNKTTFSIGRSPDNDHVLLGEKVSRHHLRIEYNAVENICYAIDTNSANGTYLNSERMIEGQRYRIIQGDRIIVDDRTFVAEYAHF